MLNGGVAATIDLGHLLDVKKGNTLTLSVSEIRETPGSENRKKPEREMRKKPVSDLRKKPVSELKKKLRESPKCELRERPGKELNIAITRQDIIGGNGIAVKRLKGLSKDVKLTQ